MARREYARIGVDMPEEGSIKALDVAPQWLYDRLLLRPEISRCGVVPWRPAVISELARDATDAKIRRWVRQLTAGNQVILDEPYAEILVRTFVRHDKLLAQPNVVQHLVYDFDLIASTKVRLAFLAELRRLWDLDDLSDSERGGWLLALGHYPRRKDRRDDPAKWPVALEPDTLGRLVKAIGPGLRGPFHAAIAAGHVRGFTPDDPHGIPEPFLTPHGGKGSPPPHPGTPPGDGSTRAPAGAPTRTVSVTGTVTGSVTGTDTVSVPQDPDHPAATAADTHTPSADDLINNHGGRLTGAVRLALTDQTRQLLNEQIDPATIAAGLELWKQKPGSGPGLLAYLVNDLMLDQQLPTKPGHRVNGSAPPWCGRCDETSRWESDDQDRWARCPRCHPSRAAATPHDATPEPAPTVDSPSLVFSPDEPPF